MSERICSDLMNCKILHLELVPVKEFSLFNEKLTFRQVAFSNFSVELSKLWLAFYYNIMNY